MGQSVVLLLAFITSCAFSMQSGQNSDTQVGVYVLPLLAKFCACSLDFASNAASHAEHAFGLCSKLEIFWASFSLPLFFFLRRRRCALFIIVPCP